MQTYLVKLDIVRTAVQKEEEEPKLADNGRISPKHARVPSLHSKRLEEGFSGTVDAGFNCFSDTRSRRQSAVFRRWEAETAIIW